MSSPQLIVIIGTLAGFLLVSGVLWFLLPKVIHAVFQAIDSLVFLDIMNYVRPTARLLSILIASMLLLATVFTVLTQLGVNTDRTQALARSAAATTGSWLGPRALKTIAILVLALLALKVSSRFSPKAVRLLMKSRQDSLGQSEVEKRAQTLEGVARGTISVAILLVMLFTLMSVFGVPVGPVLAGVGIAGIAIGFGSQSLVKDIIAGLFVLLEDQYRVGDVVRVAGTAGLVEDVNLRRTVLRDLDFIQHYIPNGEISTASNFTKEKSRVNLDISVAYKEDLDRVFDVLNEVGAAMSADEFFGELITDQIKVLRVNSFDDSGIAIKVLGETLPIRQWEVMGEYRKRVKKAFDEAGIEIPYPHRTLYWGNNVETKISQLIENAGQQARTDQTEAGN